MLEVFEGPEEDVDFWEKVLNGKVSDKEWIDFLEGRGFRSGVDYPVSHHFETLIRIFPNAKVVLTTRDPERWYESVKGTIFQVRGFTSGSVGIFNKLVGNFKRFNMACVMSNQEHHVNKRGLFDTIACGKEDSVTFYHKWVKYVKETVPSERLLVFEAKQGWQPLCTFLKLPIPEGPFPHVNDTPSMLWNFKKLRITSYITVYGIPMTLAVLMGFLMYS